MNFWIFKISNQDTYPDTPGISYVYDNTHSVKVVSGDEFIYLEKGNSKYGLTGAGRVSRITYRSALKTEQHSTKVNRVFTAHLADVVWFLKPFDLSMRTSTGKRNRKQVGLPEDLNSIGWSISIPRIERDLFLNLIDASLKDNPSQNPWTDQNFNADWQIDDSWSLVRQRSRMHAFRKAVLERHNHTCLVCGTQLRSVLDAAHIRSYAVDPGQRANPANGICLCSFCHTAYDHGDFTILPDGNLRLMIDIQDMVALKHFTEVSSKKRQNWLNGVNKQFLLERIEKK